MGKLIVRGITFSTCVGLANAAAIYWLTDIAGLWEARALYG